MQHLLKQNKMFLDSGTVYNNIIYVYKYLLLFQAAENHVHQLLERSRS